MLGVSGGVKIYFWSEPTDMRKGVDGLARIVEASMKADIYSGALFVFVSRRRDRLKILTWDTGGFIVYYKRLEAGCFKMPRMRSGSTTVELDSAQLAMLLRGIDLSRVRKPILWEPKTFDTKGIDTIGQI